MQQSGWDRSLIRFQVSALVITALFLWAFNANPVAIGEDGVEKNGDASIRIEEVFRFKAKASVVSVDFSPDGNLLAAALFRPEKNPDTVKVWHVRTGKEVANLKGHDAWVNELEFSPNGRLLATASRDQTVKLWDVGMRTEVNTLRGHDGEVWCLAFSPDARMLVTGSSDWTVKLWDVSTGKELRIIAKHRPSPDVLQFTDDGSKLLTAGGDGRAIIWDTKSFKPYSRLPVGKFAAAALSPDGQVLAITERGGVSLSDIEGNQPTVVIDTGRRGINAGVSSLAFASRKVIGFGDSGGWLGIANAETGKIIHFSQAHRRAINDLDFSPMRDLLATAGRDGDLCLFRITRDH